uniref:Uncharacterized protein n=1 Tax=Myotis myotis TaxID=51298 RepID=A0A7J7Y072_MYOMY|nr:hypothetical protein mMyoMyo1_011507 [Myotis myotis]
MRENHQSAASCTPPHWGWSQQPRACALTGNQTMTSWFIGQHTTTEPLWLGNLWLLLPNTMFSKFICGRQLDMSRARARYWQSPGRESLGAKQQTKPGKQGPCPQGNLSSPSILLIMQFRPSDLPYHWSQCSDPPLTLPPLARC